MVLINISRYQYYAVLYCGILWYKAAYFGILMLLRGIKSQLAAFNIAMYRLISRNDTTQRYR